MLCLASLRSSIHSLRIRMTSYPCNKYEQITPSFNPILDGVRAHPILEGGGAKKPPGLTLPFSV